MLSRFFSFAHSAPVFFSGHGDIGGSFQPDLPFFRVSSFLYFKVIFRDCVCVWRHFEIDLLLILNENVEYIKLVTSITFDLGWSSVVATLICSLLAKLMFRLSPIPVFDGKKQNRKKAGEKSQKSDSSNDTHTHTATHRKNVSCQNWSFCVLSLACFSFFFLVFSVWEIEITSGVLLAPSNCKLKYTLYRYRAAGG